MSQDRALIELQAVHEEMSRIFHENWGANDIDTSLSNMKECDAPVTFYELRNWIRKINKILDLLEQHNESR